MMKVEFAPNGDVEIDGPTAVVALEEGKIAVTGAEKAFTNKGTTKDYVPVLGAPDGFGDIDEGVPPEAKSIAERELRSSEHPQQPTQ